MSRFTLRSVVVVVALVPLLLAACVAPGEVEPAPSEAGDRVFPASYVPIRPRVLAAPRDPNGAPLPIFLNRHGGVYRAGDDDSARNRSSVLSSVGRSQATIGAYGGGDARWNQIVSCVGDQFARFNVTITDVEPASGPYVEAVFGGNGSELGMDNTGGVAPIDPTTCSVIHDAVVFIFTQALGGSAQVACEVAAQEIAHAFSLDHEFLCEDPMTYLDGCGSKTFQDVAAQCGEYSARDCICGRPSQNSVAVLTAKIGAAHTPGVPLPPLPPADACGGVDYFGTCSAAGVLSWCQDGALLTRDCAASGNVCSWQSDTVGYNCLPAPPAPPAPPPPPADACGGLDYYGECTADGVLRWCQDGTLNTQDCAATGRMCAWQSDTIGYNCM